MKLIIDIPEKVVTAIQNGEDYRYDIHTTIAQGIPYEERPTGDLICREALKKHITEIFEIEEKIDKKWAMGLKYSLKIIDKAPTVEILPMCMAKDEAICEQMTTDGHCNYSKPCPNKESERPQGDLISREALKIEIEKQIAYCDDKSKHQSDMEEVLRYSNTSYGLRLAHNYIDNAPTVDLKDIYQEGYYDGHLESYTKKAINEERPQGKWLHKEFDPFLKEYGQCSNCLQIERVGNFCRNCGADMRGGTE